MSETPSASSSTTSSTSARSNRIIRWRQAHGSSALSTCPPPSIITSDPQTDPIETNLSCKSEPSEFVYLQVAEPPQSSSASNKTRLLRCLRKAATMSALLADMLAQSDHLAGDFERDCPVLPLSNAYCSPNAIEQVIAWCEYHCDDPLGPTSNSTTTCGSGSSSSGGGNYKSMDEVEEEHELEWKHEIACYWDRSFIEAAIGGASINAETRAKLYDLLIAAHYLGIERLVELGAKLICKQIAGKSCDEVRALLNIAADIEPLEERRLHEDGAFLGGSSRTATTGSAPPNASCNSASFASSGNDNGTARR